MSTPSTATVHVARGASYIILQTIISSAAQAVSFAILARLITTSEMGILAVLQLVIAFGQAAGTLALPQGATKFIAEHPPRTERETAASIFYQAMRATLIISLPFAAALYIGASRISGALLSDPRFAAMFQVLAFDLILYIGLLPVLQSTLLGLQKFKEAAIFGIVSTLIRQTLIILLIIFLQNFIGLVYAWVIGDAATGIIFLAYVAKMFGPPRFNFSLTRLLKFSWPLWVGNNVSFGYSYFDRALLIVLVPLATLGIYNATLAAFNVLTAIASAVGNTLFAAYSTMQSPHQRENLTWGLKASCRYICLVVAPLSLGLMATAKPALTLFVGQAYITGTGPLMILAGTYAFTVFSVPLSSMLLALGETKISAAITALNVLISLLIAYALVTSFGMYGAATARSVALIAGTVLTLYFLSRRITVQLDSVAIAKILASGLVMAAAVVVVQMVHYSKFWIPVYLLVGAVAYSIMLRFLKVIRKDDLELLSKYLGSRLGFIAAPIQFFFLGAATRQKHDEVPDTVFGEFEKSLFCPECGGTVKEIDDYCDRCGRPLRKPNSVS